MAVTNIHDIPGNHTLVTAKIATVALGTDAQQAVCIVPFNCTVISVKGVNEAAATGNDTNNFTSSLLNGGSDGSGTTVVASKEYDTGTDIVALDPNTLTNSGTAANLLLTAGDVLVYDKTEAGSGLADPDKALEIIVQPR